MRVAKAKIDRKNSTNLSSSRINLPFASIFNWGASGAFCPSWLETLCLRTESEVAPLVIVVGFALALGEKEINLGMLAWSVRHSLHGIINGIVMNKISDGQFRSIYRTIVVGIAFVDFSQGCRTTFADGLEEVREREMKAKTFEESYFVRFNFRSKALCSIVDVLSEIIVTDFEVRSRW